MMAAMRRKKRTARVETAMMTARLIGLSIDPERDSDADMGEDVEVGVAVPCGWPVL